MGPLSKLFLVLYSLFAFYSLCGCWLFGGWIDTEVFPSLIELDNNIQPLYVYLNFNDFASGIVLLFAIMIANNWQYIVHEVSLQTNYVSAVNLYFISFFFLCCYLILNILFAFIVESYTSIDDDLKEKERLEAEKHKDEVERVR